MKIAEIIEKVRNFHGKLDDSKFDKVIWGDTDRECTGIAVCCAPTVEVLYKAHDIGANLVICHEPTFHTGRDEMEKVAGVAWVEEKTELIDKLGLTIWRDHDHMHRGVRTGKDHIYHGLMHILGWEDYVVGNAHRPLLFDIPETDAESLCRFFIDRLHLNGVRVVGDRHAKVRRVFLCGHVYGRDDEALYTRDEILQADAFIPFEVIDWTLSSLIRDAAFLGHGKVMLEMGHYNVEEAGMDYMANVRLPELLEHKVPITFVRSGDTFEYIVK